jgi:osmotically-inducible protein OsmY
MNKIRVLPILLLSGLLCLTGCVPVALVGAGAGAYASYEDRRTAGTMVEDEGIELRTNNRITERFGDKAHVNVTSYNRSVLLTGEVPDDKAKAEVEKLAQSVSNVRSVTNDVRAAALSAYSARANDSAITGKVKARFVDAGKFNAIHVKVVTEDSVVYLLGWVTETEANDAVEVARTTGGVRKVVKVFEYCKATDPACAPRSKPKAEEPKK